MNGSTGSAAAPRLEDCKDLNKRLGITKKYATALAQRFPMLRLTPRTERALGFAVKYGESLETVDDEQLLAALLQDITEGRFGAPDAHTLIAEHGDILSVAAAGVATGMTHGECMRLSLALALCLNRGARGLKLHNTRNAAFYLGNVFGYGLDASLTAAYLDGDYRTLATESHAKTVATRAQKLGAKYVIMSQHDDGELFDVKSTATALKAELAEKNIILLDWLVFDGDDYAAFDIGSALPNREIEFVYKNA